MPNVGFVYIARDLRKEEGSVGTMYVCVQFICGIAATSATFEPSVYYVCNLVSSSIEAVTFQPSRLYK